VILRRLPGALVLGLVAALLGHAALFHGEHAVGGAYHAVLVQIAIAAGLGLLGALAALLWSGARCAADGSVLAARIATGLPGLPLLGASTAFWFSLAERLEPHHAATPIALTALALACAAAIISGAARALVRWIAQIAVAFVRRATHPDLAAGRLCRDAVPQYTGNDATGRRFARAPPIVANARA
jgi:hypothetical protein